MKKIIMFVIIAVCLILILAALLVLKNINFINEDCGTSKIMEKDTAANEINPTGDKALACMGNKIINGCSKGKVVLITAKAGSITYSITGKQDNNCLIRLQYGDSDQIPTQTQKIYANKWLQCPVSVQQITSQIKDPASIGLAAYFNAIIPKSFKPDGSIKYSDDCQGTFITAQ